MAITQKEFEDFEKLIEADKPYNELACQSLLHHATSLLLPGTPLDTITILEERSYFGRADFIVSATMMEDDNRAVRSVYIWELKAPQCYLFEKDNNTRCKASDDFLSAENQLLHYAHQAMGDDTFRVRMQILDRANVRLGGVIIGTSKRFLRNQQSPIDLQNAQTALQLRRTYL